MQHQDDDTKLFSEDFCRLMVKLLRGTATLRCIPLDKVGDEYSQILGGLTIDLVVNLNAEDVFAVTS